ncbi:serine hydrolase domain-containing protein [Streptomyces aureocirculatus]|uniref:serine hydrolase domain-containing protein n=1 Tax=Streptomyces aureocirculatus TaxID=67275 RepID=UPI0004CB1E7C|nr:serine hydrolase domain-containing protein [Streptomyces aureocirculatus]
MTNKYLAVATATAAVGVLAACTGGADAPAPDADGGSARATCDPRMDSAFERWERAGFSGSIAVTTAGRADCLAAYGSADDAAGTPNTTDTVFSIGSVTKAVTAATVFNLVDDGRLRLDDRAGDLLPGRLTGPVAEVTVRQLLLHTGGLKGSHGEDHEPLDRDAALKAISQLEVAFRPGGGYAYSNAGYTLLALIIEKVSGTTYREYTASKMLRLPGGRVTGGFWEGKPAPAGPRATGYLEGGRTGERGDFTGPHWALEGNGSLAMTAGDLAAWTRALFTAELVTAESVQAISKPGHDLGEGRAETPGWVAFDASVHGKPFLASSGGGGQVGHDAVVLWIPREQRAIAITSNKPKMSAEALLKKVGPALIAGKPLPTPRTPTAPAPGAAAAVGKYTLRSGGSFDVKSAGGGITVSATGADALTTLFPPKPKPKPKPKAGTGKKPGGSAGATAADFRANERRVRDLLDGKSREGRRERAALERDFGPLRGVELGATLFHGGDVRTYVTLTTRTGPITGWYSLDAVGGIAAAEVPTKPLSLTLVPAGRDRYRPDDPAGTGPEVTVTFRAGRMSVAGPRGTTVAARAD